MKVRKSLFILTLLPVLGILPTAGVRSRDLAHADTQATTAEWQRYRVEGEEFSVLFPLAPAMTTNSITYARDKTRRERTLAAYEDGVVYLVDTYEKKGISFDDVINRIIQGKQTETVSADGIRGRSLQIEDERSLWTRQFFETSKTVYTFSAAASKVGNHSAAISKFFSSIKFGENSQGRNVADGPGEQPLTHPQGAQTDPTLKPSELTVRGRVVSKPEPRYTELARQNRTTGTVVLRVVFSSSGAVENISVIKELPDGLTDKAIESARRIRFIPAIKDGRFVSMWMQLEYNFNLY